MVGSVEALEGKVTLPAGLCLSVVQSGALFVVQLIAFLDICVKVKIAEELSPQVSKSPEAYCKCRDLNLVDKFVYKKIT